MKRIKVLLTGLGFAFAASLASTGVASAATLGQASLRCLERDGEFTTINTEGCDLSVDKLVSINGGPFVEADTSGAAASAHVGDTVTYKIVVTNTSDPGLVPQGVVYVQDVLPSGVTYGSSTATAGNYVQDPSSIFNNMWYLPLQTQSGTTLPATLTITTTANTTGLFQNTAVLTKYDYGECDGGCPYGDADPDNDSNDAWINVQVAPQVLDDSTTTPQVLADSTTLSNTGTNTAVSEIIASLLITISLVVFGSGRWYQRRTYKLHR